MGVLLVSTFNWGNAAGAKCLDIVRRLVAATRRAPPPLTKEAELDGLWVEIPAEMHVRREGVLILSHPLIYTLRFTQVSLCADVVKILMDTGVYSKDHALNDRVGAPPARRRVQTLLTDAMTQAVRFAPAAALRHLLDAGAPVNFFNTVGLTPLHMVTNVEVRDAAEKVRMLVAAGAKLEATDAAGDGTPLTPLQMALCVRGGSLPAFDALIAAGADPRKLGAPFVMSYVVSHGDVGGMRRLLDPSVMPKGVVDVNAAFADGSTPLLAAACLDHHHIVQMLLDAGAEVKTRPGIAVGSGAESIVLGAATRGAHRAVKTILAHAPLPPEACAKLADLSQTSCSNEAHIERTMSWLNGVFHGVATRTREQVQEGIAKCISVLRKAAEAPRK